MECEQFMELVVAAIAACVAQMQGGMVYRIAARASVFIPMNFMLMNAGHGLA